MRIARPLTPSRTKHGQAKACPYKKQRLIILNAGNIHNITPILSWFDRPEPPKYFTAIIDAID